MNELSSPSRPELVTGDAAMRLRLLELDLKSLRISLNDYIGAKADVERLVNDPAWPDVTDERQQAWDRMFHHAKVFVVSMRRFARLLEAAKSRKHEYPVAVAAQLELSWKTTRSFFESYVEGRNAIEHIDGELTGSNHYFLNLYGDHLEVVTGKRALIDRSALEVVERAWTRISGSVPDPRAIAMRRRELARLVRVLVARIRQCKTPANQPLQPTSGGEF
jgi:hypothetical protein